jgi:hypothetical protein
MPTVLETIKQTTATAFMALPLMLIAYTFFMGFGLGNLGLIVLLLGQITVVPLSAAGLQWVFTNIKLRTSSLSLTSLS